jgi:hypothetical protein
MEQKKTLYWITKGFISFFMFFSAWFSYSHGADLRMLGFPDYFRIELVILKIIGATVLLFPFTPLRVKEWVYAGFIITMISALVAHISTGDLPSKIVFVSVDLVLMLLSIRYVSKREFQQQKKVA